ncbi:MULTISPECIES: ribulose bisphosphate carboxylase small subunit [Pseudonocardia]|uniref:Ribulose bisphosphate carboxylase small subunit n=2 Tax=Pseudonocardia TaxID=1847 RepID=A0A1Y2MH91_PSEAH|nr:MULTISPECIES: ribulose bisphosphate carboxylase small subunit [Pseudonocardia]OSY34644.1 Ribulose bisphosphate carboxylase small chain, chromosomal [Pseudonocardia autotrophica]TDN76422.1 ribulose 1,5-bisphosphate carboxylase small subunit [Pseudonocardia autotrophica]BBG00416.1 ribulose bisphosphate carboxylase small subunit [Pseudonocardia autotrophica]GEC29504.1 ribulose bisphosphate carboxylase small subunit [Pseudonocardia saturnea]
MRITQGTFAYLPDFTDAEITQQVEYCLQNGWPLSVEFTDDPHPRNTYWEMWGLPMFDLKDPAGVLLELNACRTANPNVYVRLNAYDASLGRQTTALSFIVQRPKNEPGFQLVRQEAADRQVRYTTQAYATNRPVGDRYGQD